MKTIIMLKQFVRIALRGLEFSIALNCNNYCNNLLFLMLRRFKTYMSKNFEIFVVLAVRNQRK